MMSVRPFILLLLCLTLTLALSLSLTPVHSHPQSNNDDTQHSSATGSDTLAKPQVGTKHPQHPQKQQEVTHKHQDKTVARERPNINQGPSVRASPYHHPQDADPSSVQPPTPLSSSNITKYDDSVNGASDPSSQQVASLSPESQSQSGYGSQPDFGTPMMSQFNQSTGPVPPTYNIVNNPHRNPPRNSPPLVPDAPPMQFVQPSKNASTTIPPPSSSLAGKSNSSNGGDDDDIVTNDDPHSLPIPGSVHIPSGFPDPQRPPAASGNNPNYPSSSTRLIDQDGARDPATNDGDLPNFDPARSTRPSDHTHPPRDPHERPLTSHDHKHADEPDRIVHVTAPPSGGWRASRLRQEEHMNHQKAKHHHEKGTDKSGADGRRGGTNSYISPYGPSEEFRRNASQWMMPPDPVKLGPKPNITDPSSYQPSPAPQYWEPDAAHIAALDAERDAIHVQRVHRHGAGARTNRLASMDANSAADLSHRVVEIRNNMLFVDGAPFWIQGVCYSPVPIGESVSFAPMGDYFTPDYAYIWQRDFPLIKAMGATTLRIYGWADNADHTAFLDAVHQAGLKVLVTYYLGDAQQNPVFTQDQRNEILIRFVRQVHRYADHPAILMWSFGNELNGAWNGFTKQFSDAFNCWWQAGCAGYSDTNSDCHWQSSCMYYHLFSWINAACRAAKLVTTRPIISGFADVDYMVGPTPWLDKVARFNYVLPDMDAWAVQLYRGWTFGGYFGMYRGESQKPMIVTEFGVDAYNDACGWPENNGGGCFNMPEDAVRQGGADDNGHFWGCASGGECAKPGVQAQYEWDVRLAMELMNQYVDRGGIVWGGFLMAWTDEFWKGGGTQDLCAYPCATWDAAWCRGPGRSNYIPGGSSMCSYKAHFTCPNFDTNYHDLCGYFLSATPDNYVNEEWFGITVPVSCGLHKVNPDGVDGGYKLNSLYLRPAYIEMMQLWSGNREVDTHHTTCDALKPCWSCSVSHTIDELNDGACEKECAIKHADVGPGSSTRSINRRRNSLMNQLLHGSSDPDSLWSQFGVTLIVGLVIIGLATMISAVLWNQRQRSIIE